MIYEKMEGLEYLFNEKIVEGGVITASSVINLFPSQTPASFDLDILMGILAIPYYL